MYNLLHICVLPTSDVLCGEVDLGKVYHAIHHGISHSGVDAAQFSFGLMLSLEMMHCWLIRPVNHTCALRTRLTDDNNSDDDNVTMQMMHGRLNKTSQSFLCSLPSAQNKVNRWWCTYHFISCFSQRIQKGYSSRMSITLDAKVKP